MAAKRPKCIIVDPSLDERLRPLVPVYMRGDRKTALRVQYAVTDWLEQQEAKNAPAVRQRSATKG